MVWVIWRPWQMSYLFFFFIFHIGNFTWNEIYVVLNHSLIFLLVFGLTVYGYRCTHSHILGLDDAWKVFLHFLWGEVRCDFMQYPWASTGAPDTWPTNNIHNSVPFKNHNHERSTKIKAPLTPTFPPSFKSLRNQTASQSHILVELVPFKNTSSSSCCWCLLITCQRRRMRGEEERLWRMCVKLTGVAEVARVCVQHKIF